MLANWIASKDNPLTARVMVNRIWQHHLGKGIVASSNDFGKFGSPPTHPELLDWLATEFIRSGWSMKHMHRLIMLSEAYRRTSFQARSKDELGSSSYVPHRLTFEEARDAWLAARKRPR